MENILSIHRYLDALATLFKNMENTSQFWQSGAHESLLFAKAWLGGVLRELGEQTPYKNDGKRKDAADIEPTADTGKEMEFRRTPHVNDSDSRVLAVYASDVEPDETITEVEKIDCLHQEVLGQMDVVKGLDVTGWSREALISRSNAWSCLAECRFKLGFALQHIKELQTAENKAAANLSNE